MGKEIKKNVLLSIQNASYQYSDAEEDEYALKNVSYDFETGKRIAGVTTADGSALNDLSCEEIMYDMVINPSKYAAPADTGAPTNTTIGIILTNASFNKTQLCKLAGMTHDGYARCIRPIHTSMDGDSIYAMSLGDLPYDLDTVGTLANHVMCEAIRRSVTSV